jgi:hypothetical protein
MGIGGPEGPIFELNTLELDLPCVRFQVKNWVADVHTQPKFPCFSPWDMGLSWGYLGIRIGGTPNSHT